ncbi:ATP-binding protein [Alistipes sp.]|uniref:tetratricopeptide repeat-containing sensor histidine kinase n=1 Tax=Alistipes sp. TaxID=1872444 RepID=UPI003AF0B371
MKKYALLLLTLLLLVRPLGGRAQEADSTLIGYYTWCNRHPTDPDMPLKADTLFRLAGEQGNRRMQSVALCLHTDHYYYTNNLDSLKVWVAKTQQFTRTYNQLTHYYFVWARLILHYTKYGKYTLALYELGRYQTQAFKDDFKPAIAEAYKQMGHIYRTQASYDLAVENYRKGIEFIEENHLKDVDLSYYYLQMGETYAFCGRYTQALEALDKGETCLLQPYHIWRIKLAQANVYAQHKEFSKARRLLDEIREKGSRYITEEKIGEIELLLFVGTGAYQQALALVNRRLESYRGEQQENDHKDNRLHYYYTPLLITRSSIYQRMGNYRAACDDLSQYAELWRQKIEGENREMLNEFATLLDVERLDRETAEARQEAQAERLRRNNVLITALAAILALAGAFIALQLRTNRHLARAKRAAEEADRMKGIFIRHITHEINTPLNAIVGFAELAAATPPPGEEERGAYLDIIRENSGFLQKLVDDVLYISDIESTLTPPARSEVDIDACCRDCLETAALQTQDPARLRYEPGTVPCRVSTSRQYVTKVLNELLRNALHHTSGPVTLSYASDAGGGVRFTVTDAGSGIPAAETERIFERFVKLDPFSQGMGLGLNVCRLIARTLGGDVVLDPASTAGARFVFTIPGA